MPKNTQSASESQQYWIRSSLLTLLEKGFGLLFGLGMSMLLWRNLSKAEMGSWAMFVLIAAFVEMARSGMIQNALMSFIATYRDQTQSIKEIQTSAFVLSLAFSIISSVLLYFGMYFLAQKLNSPILPAIIPLYLLVNFSMILLYHANYIQQAYFEFRGIFWSTFFYRGIPFGYVLYCSLRQMNISLTTLTTSMLLGAVLGGSISTWYAWPYFNHARSVSMEWLAKVASYGKFVLGTNMSTMLYKNVDKVAIGGLLGAESLAVYDAAAKITQLVEVPSFSIAAVVFPQSAKAATESGPEGIKYLYERSVAAILAFILPFVCICFVFAEPIVVLLAGENYRESAGVLRLTALFSLFLPFAVQFGTILDSTGKPHINFRYNACVALLNLCLAYVMVQKLGLYGGAVAALITYTVSFVFMQRLLKQQYQISATSVFKQVPLMYKQVWQTLQTKMKRVEA
jgi:lipopolysaccharide exporter